MNIFYSHRAAKEFAALPRHEQKRVAVKMRFYIRQSDPLAFAERLTDYREGQFRFRIGKYRVTFDVRDNTIFVLKVGRRDEIY